LQFHPSITVTDHTPRGIFLALHGKGNGGNYRGSMLAFANHAIRLHHLFADRDNGKDMSIQFQAICDVIQSLAQSARDIADDYFTHHVRVDERIADGADPPARTRFALTACDAIGRDQQRQLSKLLNDLDRLSGSTWYSALLRHEIHTCRQTICEERRSATFHTITTLHFATPP
jgi:hypothetical protein